MPARWHLFFFQSECILIATCFISFDDGQTYSLLRVKGADVRNADGELDGTATLAAFEHATESTGDHEVITEYLDEVIRPAVELNPDYFGSDGELMRSLLIAGGAEVKVKTTKRDDRGLISQVVETTV